jgi:mannose-6-phosphate isomerase-like protein (cupin superfamily)
MNDLAFFETGQLEKQRAAGGKLYHEFLRIPTMSAGVYSLAAGTNDPQSPHKQDELYYVVRGGARLRAATEEQAVGPGSVIFVAANVEHSFYDVSEELLLLVFFAPAESS